MPILPWIHMGRGYWCVVYYHLVPRALVDIRSLVFLSPRIHQPSSQASRSRPLHHLAQVHNARDTAAPHHPSLHLLPAHDIAFLPASPINYPAANCSACLRAPCFSLG
ncbi:hypothetical protein B0H13DRAFT_2327590 [Mycena leptocephala]|nr:hypothetical protein B0H13DRAFT_2327590 [Mycena leptocephala]